MSKEKTINDWYVCIIKQCSESQELDLPDKVLIRNCINQFVNEYIENTKQEPDLYINNILLFYFNHLNPFGFVIPLAEKIIDESTDTMQRYARFYNVDPLLIKRPKTIKS